MSFFFKLLFEVLNLFCNNRFVFLLAKKLALFDAVFVMYPADQSFADYFTFRLRQRFIRFKPYIVGMITHPSGARTLMFAISAHIDGEHADADAETIRRFHFSVEDIRESLGARTTHFAGTLPSRFSTLKVKRGINTKNERLATTINVVKAVHAVRQMHNHTLVHPVVILGCNGYIGREVSHQLRLDGLVVIGVDVSGYLAEGVVQATSYKNPKIPHLVVNITRPEVINDYIDGQMDGNTVFLNEVYPSPHEDVVLAMKERSVVPHHIAGVKAKVFPRFPRAYTEAVPCCAALPEESYEIILKPL